MKGKYVMLMKNNKTSGTCKGIGKKKWIIWSKLLKTTLKVNTEQKCLRQLLNLEQCWSVNSVIMNARQKCQALCDHRTVHIYIYIHFGLFLYVLSWIVLVCLVWFCFDLFYPFFYFFSVLLFCDLFCSVPIGLRCT